jgi:hypothetical protein
MWKIFSVPCGSALYKFHCICTLSEKPDLSLNLIEDAICMLDGAWVLRTELTSSLQALKSLHAEVTSG